MIQVVECHFEVVFCFLTNRNCYFFEVDKATIEVVEWHLEVIVSILTSRKFHFGEIEKSKFQVVAWHWEHFLPPDHPKCDVSRARMAL